MVELAKLLEPINGDPVRAQMGIIFHIVVAILVALVIGMYAVPLLTKTLNGPSSPVGAIGKNYDTLQGSRQSLKAYMAANNIDDSVSLTQFQVATANFGGIFTEARGLLNPWTGTVSPDAATMQVQAGARAIVFDIWPDPANMANPVVCAMVDTSQWWYQNWWRNTGGMTQGQGTYSNWQLLTRNKVDAGTMMQAAVTAAFNQSSPQSGDPFFLILHLHGAMSISYLNTLGSKLQTALQGRGLSTTYGQWQQQSKLCSAPISEFIGTGTSAGGFAYVIVIPDMSPGYNILPGINTYSGFTAALKGTTLGDLTNAVEQNPNTMYFTPGGIGPIAVQNQPNCLLGATTQLTLAQAGFCLVQPSIGGQATDNGTLFKDNSFQNCQQTGAQFVAANLFSQDSADGILQAWFDPKMFGTYSFKKGT